MSDLAFSFVVRNTFSTLASDNSRDAFYLFVANSFYFFAYFLRERLKQISQEDNFFSTSWLGVGDIHNPFKPQISSSPCVQEVYVRNSVADPGFPREMKKIGSLRGGVPLNPPIN